MARLSKICYSSVCRGTRQPVAVTMGPAGDNGNAVAYVATCKTCGAVHPPDSAEAVADAKAWEAATRAENNGAIPIAAAEAVKGATT